MDYVDYRTYGTLQTAVNSYPAILVPIGVVAALPATLDIPDGVRLCVSGEISGPYIINVHGNFILLGYGSLTNGNVGTLNLIPSVTNSDITIRDVTISGGHGADGIIVSPQANVVSVKINKTRIRKVAYGILRASSPGFTVSNVEIEGNIISDTNGDGIEWNLGEGDSIISIVGNEISSILGTVSASGIGIGLAGNTYSEPPVLTNYITDISIQNNIVDTCAVGIHAEVCARFNIANNIVRNAVQANAPGGGIIDASAIQVYGAQYAKISGNELSDCDRGIICGLGAIAGTPGPPPTPLIYIDSPNHILIDNNHLYRCGATSPEGIFTQCACPASLTLNGTNQLPRLDINNNTLDQCGMTHVGMCNLSVKNNNIFTQAGVTGFSLDYYSSALSSNYQNASMPRLLRIINNDVYDTLGNANVVLQNLENPNSWDGNTSLQCFGNSFEVDITSQSDHPIQLIRYTTTAGLGGPAYGKTYQKGTLIIDTATPARYLTTNTGSRNFASDTYTISDAPNGIIQSSNLPWTADNAHTVGQAVTLTDSSMTTVSGFIGRIYIAGGGYRMLIVDSSGAPIALGALGSGTITPTTALTWIVV